MFYDIVLKLQRFKKLKIILISNFNKGDGMWVSYYLKFLNRKSISSVQFSSVAQSCPTLCDPMDRSTLDLPITNSWSSPKLMSIESVMPSNHLILCHPLLLPPSIFPSIRVFSSESVLCIRWPKYWSFSFSISPSEESPVLRVKAKPKIWSPLVEMHPPRSSQPLVFTL